MGQPGKSIMVDKDAELQNDVTPETPPHEDEGASMALDPQTQGSAAPEAPMPESSTNIEAGDKASTEGTTPEETAEVEETKEETQPQAETPPEEGSEPEETAGGEEETQPQAEAAPGEITETQAETPSEEENASEESEGEATEKEHEGGAAHVNFDLLDTEGRWLLKVLSGPNTGAEFAMHSGSAYLIGTDTQQCDVVFQDLSVSRKHARLTIDLKNEAILEDLESRNGTFVDGTRIDKHGVTGNVLVAMGTTTFMLIDREAEQTTIVASLNVTEKEKEEPEEHPLEAIEGATHAPIKSEIDKMKEEEEQKQAQESQAVSSLVILAAVTALILVVGIGGSFLFRTETIASPQVVNPEEEIARTLEGFPEVRFSYDPTNSRLMLVGHVLTSTDRSSMIDLLRRLKFIRIIDYHNVVIDEHVWREANQILGKNPAWRGITITSPRAGHYVLSGFLKTRNEAQALYDYISQNFDYVNLLERRVIVEEELLGQLQRELREAGFPGVTPALTGGDLVLKGTISTATMDKFQKLVTVFKTLPGIRSVQSMVAEGGKVEALIDLTNKYSVSGYSKHGDLTTVVINGRILSPGDSLDGKLITSITSSRIYLEEGSEKYKIDFNR